MKPHPSKIDVALSFMHPYTLSCSLLFCCFILQSTSWTLFLERCGINKMYHHSSPSSSSSYSSHYYSYSIHDLQLMINMQDNKCVSFCKFLHWWLAVLKSKKKKGAWQEVKTGRLLMKSWLLLILCLVVSQNRILTCNSTTVQQLLGKKWWITQTVIKLEWVY